MSKDNIVYIVILIIASLLAGIGGYKLNINTAKPKEIIKEVIVQDTELLNSYIKLQEQYRELQFSYNEFERYLEGFERGYLKAKGIEVEE